MTPETVPDLERIFTLMDELEAGRQPAIDRLLQQRADIEDKLRRLRYSNGSASIDTLSAVTIEPPALDAKLLVRHCSKCGRAGHDSRSCKKFLDRK